METEEKDRNMGFNITGVAFGAALGVITGVVMGVLFAPKSGKETRAQMGEWLKEKRDQGSDLLAKVKEEATHRQSQIAASIDAGKHAYAETMKHGNGS